MVTRPPESVIMALGAIAIIIAAAAIITYSLWVLLVAVILGLLALRLST